MRQLTLLLIIIHLTASCVQNESKKKEAQATAVDSINLKLNVPADSLIDLKSYIVRVPKSYFFNLPDSQSKRSDYLLKGDFVQVNKINNGLGYAVHPISSGNDVSGWIILNNLEPIIFTAPKGIIIDSSE